MVVPRERDEENSGKHYPTLGSVNAVMIPIAVLSVSNI